MIVTVPKNHYGWLRSALAIANTQFDGNLVFNRCDFLGVTRDKLHLRFAVTLKAKSSRGKGAKVVKRYYPGGAYHERHIPFACWHAHGAFIDALPPGSTVSSLGHISHPGDAWRDWNAGSIMFPVMASEMCDCEGV